MNVIVWLDKKKGINNMDKFNRLVKNKPVVISNGESVNQDVMSITPADFDALALYIQGKIPSSELPPVLRRVFDDSNKSVSAVVWETVGRESR